jgi:chromosome segregation ATPase
MKIDFQHFSIVVALAIGFISTTVTADTIENIKKKSTIATDNNISIEDEELALKHLLGLKEYIENSEKKEAELKTAEAKLKTAEAKLKAAEAKLKTADAGLKTADAGLKTADAKGKKLDNRLEVLREETKKIDKDLKSIKYVLKVFEKGMGK